MDLLSGTPFHEIAALLLVAVVVAAGGMLLRQPLIVSFIAVGVLAGPSFLNIVTSSAHVDLLAELGVALLLFLVGLKLDVGLVRAFGRVAVMTGMGQVIFTSVVGYLLCLGLGFSHLESLYIAVALTFSSTIIIVKLLSDKQEIDSLHGRIALGFLIVQDLVVVFAMVVLSAVDAGMQGGGGLLPILRVIGGGALLLVAIGLFTRYLAERLLSRIARSPELLVLAAMGWAATVAAGADMIGLSRELGGLIAGASLGSTSYREAIASRLASLRDFLLLFFFLHLGGLFDLRAAAAQIPNAIVLSLFVLIGNPLIVMVIMGVLGYRKRTGLLAGLTVAQISEFSLVFVALGAGLGHIGVDAVGLTTLVGVVTIALSTYMILYSDVLYRWLEPVIGIFERRVPFSEDRMSAPADERWDAIIFGLGRYGTAIASQLGQKGWRIHGVDFDPEAVAAWTRTGRVAVYGDASDPDFPAILPLAGTRWVICTARPPVTDLAHSEPRLALLEALRAHGYRGRVALAARDAADAAHMSRMGADLVLLPFDDAAERAAEVILLDSEQTTTA
ncbi:MAG: cation:proton antiporter [Alphaproteobacteria bacterium]|nr:cation:proton antiporter [Alphaproteobacteria bacterium]